MKNAARFLSGGTRAYNPSVNGRPGCSGLALQTQTLDARKPDYRVSWGESGPPPSPEVCHPLVALVPSLAHRRTVQKFARYVAGSTQQVKGASGSGSCNNWS